MKKYEKIFSIITFIIIFTICNIGITRAATTVNLGTADSFGVLAGSMITNTGPSTINGDVGVFPTITETGFGTITLNGINNLGNAFTQSAKNDLVTAYINAAGQVPVTTIATELGGTVIIPGIYNSAAGTFGITGTLTLDAQGDSSAVFIFKTASTLITASSSKVVLLNGAQACNVYWQVGSSATLGTNSIFKGSIIALSSITATTGANIEGRLLARNGAVTLDTNTITKAICTTSSNGGTMEPNAKFNIIKHVDNGTGGTAIASDFIIHIKRNGFDIIGSPSFGKESPGTNMFIRASTVIVSEETNSGYVMSFSGACSSSGLVTLIGGDNKTCIITNTHIPVTPTPLVNTGTTTTPLVNTGTTTTPLVNTGTTTTPVELIPQTPATDITKSATGSLKLKTTTPGFPDTGFPPEEKSSQGIIIILISILSIASILTFAFIKKSKV